MKRDHSDCKRGFHHLSESYYSVDVLPTLKAVDEVILGFYHEDGGTTGEFAVRWIELAGRVTPKLCAFDDSWSTLYEFKDVLEKLADVDGDDITPHQFCEILKSCGFIDMTKRLQPR